jgi:enoyl-CoA hydratase/carnithine racemase
MSKPEIPSTTHLKLTLQGPVLSVEIDHGRANEMGAALLDEWERIAEALEGGLATALLSWSARRSPKGAPIFISGADVTERTGWSEAQVKAHVRRQRAVLARLRAVPVLHVAVVHGVALGWGTEFLLTADYRVGTPEARFGLPETGLGILPGAGGTAELWAQVGVAHAMRLGLTGEQIDATEALRIGLIQEVAGDLSQGLARARGLADLAARRSPTAIAAFKQGVLASVGLNPDQRAEVEARAYEHCVETGEAARGRAQFKAILAGETPQWGPLVRP